jgi:hypothetical protein
VKIAGRGTATVTNVDTGESITYNTSGPYTYTVAGGAVSVDAAGPNLLYTTQDNSADGVPPIFYSNGHLQFTYTIKSGQTTDFKLTGHITDVCEALS